MTERTGGRRVAVTGAAGFIGRAVIERIDRGMLGPIAELRLNDVRPVSHPTATIVPGSYADRDVRDRLVAGQLDMLFHLASVPGGAAERDPVLGRRVNLDASIALVDAVAGPPTPVIVYTSSIAVLGRGRQAVTDAAALRPSGSYGTHKAMIELYLADLTRRGLVDSRAVRPAGVVARPCGTSGGFATAWMSDLFHAAVERHPLSIPVRADAHIWLQSVDAVANNIIHSARLPEEGLPPERVWTLPATVARIGAIVAALERRTGHPVTLTYGDDPTDQPPLVADAALAAGFASDGNVEALVAAVVAQIERG